MPLHIAEMIHSREEPHPQVLKSRRVEQHCVWNGSTNYSVGLEPM